MTAECREPTGRSAARFCKYCLLPKTGEPAIQGFTGFVQWMDVALAEAWFAEALRLTNPAAIDALENRPYMEQAEHVTNIYRALQFGYMSMNLPASTDPVFRDMWRKWFSGYPPGTTYSGDNIPRDALIPGQDNIQNDATQYSVPPEVALVDGKYNPWFRFVNSEDMIKKGLSFDEEGRRTPENRYGIIRARAANRMIAIEPNISERLRIIFPVYIDMFGLMERGNWPYINGGPTWDNTQKRVARIENGALPTPGNTQMSALLTFVSSNAISQTHADPRFPVNTNVDIDISHSSMPGIPQGIFNMTAHHGDGGTTLGRIDLQNWTWNSWYQTQAGNDIPGIRGSGSMYVSATMKDMVEPARWLAERCTSIDPQTGAHRFVSAQEIVYRARLDGQSRLGSLADSRQSVLDSLTKRTGDAALVNQWANSGDETSKMVGMAIMAVGGAVMSAQPVVGAIIMAIGAAVNVIGQFIHNDYSAGTAYGMDEFGQWKPTLPWPYIFGDIKTPPSFELPAPPGYQAPASPLGPGVNGCEPANQVVRTAVKHGPLIRASNQQAIDRIRTKVQAVATDNNVVSKMAEDVALSQTPHELFLQRQLSAEEPVQENKSKLPIIATVGVAGVVAAVVVYKMTKKRTS